MNILLWPDCGLTRGGPGLEYERRGNTCRRRNLKYIINHSAHFSANLISSALNLGVSSRNKLWPLFSKATMCEFEIPAFICSARSKEHILSFLPGIITVGIVIFTR